jgi:hypothetical protein
MCIANSRDRTCPSLSILNDPFSRPFQVVTKFHNVIKYGNCLENYLRNMGNEEDEVRRETAN